MSGHNPIIFILNIPVGWYINKTKRILLMAKIMANGITINRILETAKMLKGFKKQLSVLKQLDGKYYKAGIAMKEQGITSTDAIRRVREKE